MATRERKPKLNSDSPTPSVNSSESATSTPTTGKKKLNARGRRSGRSDDSAVSPGKDKDEEKSNQEEDNKDVKTKLEKPSDDKNKTNLTDKKYTKKKGIVNKPLKGDSKIEDKKIKLTTTKKQYGSRNLGIKKGGLLTRRSLPEISERTARATLKRRRSTAGHISTNKKFTKKKIIKLEDMKKELNKGETIKTETIIKKENLEPTIKMEVEENIALVETIKREISDVIKKEENNSIQPQIVKKKLGRPRKITSDDSSAPLTLKRKHSTEEAISKLEIEKKAKLEVSSNESITTDKKQKIELESSFVCVADLKKESYSEIEHMDNDTNSEVDLIKLRCDSETPSKYSDTTDNDSLYGKNFQSGFIEISNPDDQCDDVSKDDGETVIVGLDGKPVTDKIEENLRKKPLRRSGRPKKPNAKETSSTTGKSTKTDQSLNETPFVSDQAESNGVKALHIETGTKQETSILSNVKIETDKDLSLSPQLESEGVSEISVKQFYGEPAFLENNLGIEKDPKLGEIVQVHEKNILDNTEKNTKKIIESNLDANTVESNSNLDRKGTETFIKNELVEDIETKNSENMLKNEELLKQKLQIRAIKTVPHSPIIETKQNAVTSEVKTSILQSILPIEQFPHIEKLIIEPQIYGKNDNFIEKEISKPKEKDASIVIDDDGIMNKTSEPIDENPVSYLSFFKEIAKNDSIKTHIEENVEDQILAMSKPELKYDDESLGEELKMDESLDEIIDEETKITNEIIEKIETAIKEVEETKKHVLDEVPEKTNVIDSLKPKFTPEQKKIIIIEDKKISLPSEISIYKETMLESIIKNKAKLSKPTEIQLCAVDSPIIEIKLDDERHPNKLMTDIVIESPEIIKLKETHLKSLGLLTIKAADEAKNQKLRQKELLQSSSSSSSSSTNSKSSKSSKTQNNGNSNVEYTGTLKTVIKLHRPVTNEKRKRLPLKMTFQKGRGKANNDKDANILGDGADETYYTIHKDSEQLESTQGGQSRKTHYRSYTEATVAPTTEVTDTVGEVKKALVIPEKASSFSIHPGRVCRDQCFYCGGKFGLFDTPCHVAQIKSEERQKKILNNEEKLTVDSCLCDACYRHVDRRANCPSYKKRLSAPATITQPLIYNNNNNDQNIQNSSLTNEIEKRLPLCNVSNCNHHASHSLRKKWFVKMNKSIEHLLHVNLETTNTATMIHICDSHFDVISHLMVCSLCKRKLPKNHMYYIYQDIETLEKHLSNQGVPVILGSTPVVCKLCRYFANLLLKPPEIKTQKAQFVKNYRRRLLQFNNAEAPDEGNYLKEQHHYSSPHTKTNEYEIFEHKQTSKTSVNISETSHDGGHIVLDNDVMVDYDVPTIENSLNNLKPNVQAYHKPAQQRVQQSLLIGKQPVNGSQDTSIDPNTNVARVLRSNPSISMRELFPGEEEMGLYANIPLQSGKKTPEGWSKVQTVIQYDDVTKQMFEELQKPYGNQSSFLRHLVLLEKYYRNGDLILSQNATYNAVGYSEAVQNRLKSYDNIPTNSLALIQHLSNAPITITPAVTIKPKPKSCDLSNTNLPSSSLLKSCNNSNNSNNASASSNTSNNNNTINKSNRQISVTTESNQQEILDAASKFISSDETVLLPSKKLSASLPPDLISISKNQSTIATPVSNRKSPVPNTTTKSISSFSIPSQIVMPPSVSITASISNTVMTTATTTTPTPTACKPTSPQTSVNHKTPPLPSNVIKLPDTLSATERKQTNGKPWRPTLIPITPGSNSNNQGKLYQTADGRRLPSLVQVMSGGNPYHISIHDYNRMCILRREKLMQLQISQKLQNANKHSNNNNSSSSSNSSASGSKISNQIVPNISKEDNNNKTNKNSSTLVVGSNNKKIQIPNKILEQNSLIPVGLSKSNYSENRNRSKIGTNNNSTSLLKYQHATIAPKPTQLSNSTTILAISSSQPPIITANMLNTFSSPPPLTITTTNNSTTTSVILPSSIEMIKTTSSGIYPWSSSLADNGPLNGSCTITATGSGGSILLDNSAISVLSKVPKSLTVIPQKKGSSRISSIEDLTSA